jgi:cob(I)alamin adenosyltransferase
MLYTRKGDDGTSTLFDQAKRLPKDSLVYEALGTVDECNSLIGVCRATAAEGEYQLDVSNIFLKVQENLFVIQGEIAGAKMSMTAIKIKELEQTIDQIEEQITNPQSFVIPGSTKFSALCDYARTVVRRAERGLVALAKTRNISATTLGYINRLSSLLYALARYSAKQNQVKELTPTY